MIKANGYELMFCLDCKKIVKEFNCSCNGQNYLFGDNIELQNGAIICDSCGGNQFQMTMHMNRTDSSLKNYKCENCSNGVFGIETKKSDYMKLFED